MEELANFWYQEGVDELKQKLLYTTVELETTKNEAAQQTKRHNEDIKQLLNLLNVMQQERDEAREQLQLQNLLIKKQQLFSSSTTKTDDLFSKQPPLTLIQLKSNSSITESNSLSHAGSGSSPVESFFDTVHSPDLSNNMADSTQTGLLNQIFVQEFSAPVELPSAADPVIDNLAGKSLPEKGKLLQAVMDAGPLLQTLLVAGPLPRWRNPPPRQSFKIPPVSIKGCETPNTRKAEVLGTEVGSTCVQQINSSSILNFSSCGPLNVSNEQGIHGFGDSFSTQIPKRQRFY
ncbi:hypothetical protein ACFE04_006009 [Oxalis oulophora]